MTLRISNIRWIIVVAAGLVSALLALLFASIVERRAESAQRQRPLQPIAPWESDSARWAVNWPRQFASWRQSEDSSTHTKWGGSYPRDLLAETPANVILFAGYPFSTDYKQARGHFHAVRDVHETGRDIDGSKGNWPAKPSTCWSCKSSDVPRLLAEMGAAKFYDTPAKDLFHAINHPIGCIDCHDPQTMALRISRPALIEAYERQGKDIRLVSHQEMRSLVCAQCHVEYYFRKDEQLNRKAYLVFPWDEGLSVEDMERYYDSYGFADWTHSISGARMIKMQHPDYELYTKGIHAYRNVSCADCHMPYKTEGGQKFTDHHIRSPLLTISQSCAVCHRWSEQELRSRVESIQDSVARSRSIAEDVLCKAHFDIAACQQAGAKDDELVEARRFLRRAQLRWDYVAAANGVGFHAPQEALRILTEAVDLAQQCRLQCSRILARYGITDPVQYPDWSTKEKAQALIKQFTKGGQPPRLIAAKP
ncbi:MAG: ammonia-forming cytochrome c nitrite reductase subunit c552 [Planctomycetota bacterium]|nr:ammonia-forming cytochrome c nitrite reductase subunit c552 [Planctomycetota bacterium]MCX8039967.1 ammonia-forming cytochrome c nitrite reductase subunit c552 [Planctomycetota bacterium]